MRLLLPALVVVGLLLPVAALSTTLRATTPTTVPALSTPTVAGDEAARTYPNNVLVVSATEGLRLSRDGGKSWATPRGTPARGSFYPTIAANPTVNGTAYASNGYVYKTVDGGQSWQPLRADAGALGSGGASALAAGAGGALYAAGAHVVVYLTSYNGHTAWRPWGRGWPAGAHATLLLATPAHGLYAAAGDTLYNAVGKTAAWTPIHGWSAPITAMTLGPDRATPYVAVQGQGIWRAGAGGTPTQQLDNNGLPTDAPVYALQSDPTGDDLYAAAGGALLRRHRPADAAPRSWQLALSIPDGAITALQPLQRGQNQTMFAVSQDGQIYTGTRDRGESLTWSSAQVRAIGGGAPLIAALSGAQWQQPTEPPALPKMFTSSGLCAFPGAKLSQSFDVCGPFRTFYFEFGEQALLGYPLDVARLTASGDVEQPFEKVRLAWTPQTGVRLVPLRAILGQDLRFPHPTYAQGAQITARGGVCFPKGYCVDPRFAAFWRTYLYQSTGASIFGPPISQAFEEQASDGTGNRVYVQYFENARLEEGTGGLPTVSFLRGIPRH
jgi:hypothetical protein